MTCFQAHQLYDIHAKILAIMENIARGQFSKYRVDAITIILRGRTTVFGRNYL
jgi:hypothetical protein